MSDFDSGKFRKELEKLIKVSHEVLGIFPKDNVFVVKLIKYKKILEGTPDDKLEQYHGELFSKVFARLSQDIIKGSDNDQWISNTKERVKIIFGSNLDGFNFEEDKIPEIDLTAVYSLAKKCKLKTEKQLKEENAGDEEYQKYRELIHPEALLLHLYRIFRLVSTEEKYDAQLLNIISDLQVSLGIEKASNAATGLDAFGGAGAIGEGIGGLFSILSELQGNVDAGAIARGEINPEEIGDLAKNVVGKLMSNEGLKKVVNNLKENSKCSPTVAALPAPGRRLSGTVLRRERRAAGT